VLDCKTYQLEEEVKRCSTSIQTLEKEKSVLQEQLSDAKSSLKAAARLTNQLDLKSEQIDSLQNEGNSFNPLQVL
jgi:predicted  nucleic acid-binding Zn-ribbon protein